MSDCSTHAFDAPLKPCPFCGGEAKVFAKHYENGGHKWWVGCVKCGATIVGETSILAWNNRAERTCENTSQHKSVFNCSECKWVCSDIYSCESEFTYCPNCGAKVVSE